MSVWETWGDQLGYPTNTAERFLQMLRQQGHTVKLVHRKSGEPSGHKAIKIRKLHDA